jgi:hypothetical protein
MKISPEIDHLSLLVLGLVQLFFQITTAFTKGHRVISLLTKVGSDNRSVQLEIETDYGIDHTVEHDGPSQKQMEQYFYHGHAADFSPLNTLLN